MSNAANLAAALERNAARRAAKKSGIDLGGADGGIDLGATAPAALPTALRPVTRGGVAEADSLREQVEVLSEQLAVLRAAEFSKPGVNRRAQGVPDVDSDDISIESDKVAQGGFSVLYKGVWRGTDVAIKKPVDPRAGMDAKLRAEFEHEVEVLSEIRHPNIVLLMGACLRPPKLCMVFEWATGGSLFEFLHHGQRDFPRPAMHRVAVGIATGLVFLHSTSPPIVHRDIKSHNVLIDAELSRVQICDFGLAMRESDASSARTGQGTPMYMAPEILRGESYHLASDVYAFGILLNEMVAREVPFGGYDVMAIQTRAKAGERPPIPLTCPRAFSQIITQCWHQDPDRRPRMVQVVQQLRAL